MVNRETRNDIARAGTHGPGRPLPPVDVEEQLFCLVRHRAESLVSPDKKQLRFNDIVRVAKAFYPHDVDGGVCELVDSCGREDPSYVSKNPMWQTLETSYSWMLIVC